MQATYSNENVSTHQDYSTSAVAASAANAPTGRFVGFGHMLKKQMRDWYGTRKWLWVGGASALLGAAFPFLMYLASQVAASEGEAIPVKMLIDMPMILLGTILVIVPVLLAMGEVVEEKKSGTAAWIMSKPASRYGFILSKWVAITVNVVLLSLLLPGATAFALSSVLFNVSFSITSIAGALGILALYYTTVVAATLFFSVVLKSQGAVAAVVLGAMLLLPMINFMPLVVELMPTTMFHIASALVHTGQVFSYLPIVSGAAITAASLAAAMVVFNRQEL
jgi:ABC-type transport system involved in multi-copper enzyme maturation permease subunit